MSFAPIWYRWILLVPFYALAWQCLRTVALPSAWHRLSLSTGLGTAAIVLLTMLSAPWTGDLGFSLILGSGLAALLAWLLRSPEPRSIPWTLSFSGWHLALLLWVAWTSLMVGIIGFRFDFHDQMRTQGHPAVIEALLRGNFPPHLQAFPQIPLKYHFGGDLLAALLAYVFGLSGVQAINVLQLGGWIFANLCLYSLCRSLGLNRLLTLLAMNWVLLAAGWLYLLKPWLGLPALGQDGQWPDNYVIFGRYLNPGVFSYFFQTPYALGLPVFFTYLAIFQSWLRQKSLGILILCLVLHGALSVIHITLFLGALGCALAAILGQWVFAGDSWKKRLSEALVFFVVVLAIGLCLGGFFSRSDSYSSGLLVFQWPPGYLRYASKQAIGLGDSLLWYFATLGSLVLWMVPALFLVGKSFLNRRYHPMQFFFFCFATGAFLFPQFFHYRLSWDIIKWFTAFQISLILLVVLSASMVQRGRLLIIVCILISSILDTLPSYRMLTGLSFGNAGQYQGKQKDWFKLKIDNNLPWLRFLEGKLRGHPWREMVLAPPRLSDSLSIVSGQSMASLDYNTVAFGVRPEILQRRRADIQGLLQSFDLERMKASPVRWLIFPCKEFDKSFSPASRSAVEAAAISGKLLQIHVPNELGCWKVFRTPD